ncbi:MAG: ABC transporter permease [Moorellaceae bacterium]
MVFLTAFQMAWRSILANKLRSALTMLGIIIGVMAVIVMVALSQGARSRVTERIASMGSNLLVITPGYGMGPVRGAAVANRLTYDDAQAIARLPMVKNVAPEVSTEATVTYGNQTWTATVSGTTPSLQAIRDWPLEQGEFFTEADVANMSMVAVIGRTVADNLFSSGTNPVGSRIQIKGLSFTVLGVLTSKGASMGGMDQDNTIYIPLTTAQQRLIGTKYVRQISVQAETAEALTALQDAITTLLRQRHHLAANAADDFTIRNMAALLSAIEDTTRIMTFLLGGIAAVSLVVGGIGIMNIMLVSVTERTREIGIRMAVGATPSDILIQFLVESFVLSLSGGLMGTVLGWATTRLLGWLAGWKMALVPWVIALAIGFAAAVGIFFGYYPAKRAADANPIEALRFE